MMSPLALTILIPFIGAAIVACAPGPRLASAGVAATTLAALIAAAFLPFGAREAGDYFILDDVNLVFIELNAFVAFTTSLYGATYVANEIATGRLTPALSRLYHAMYLAMLGAMNLALAANNIGLLWVGLELATLITVVMVGLYRTPAAIEAAWKYFILGSVGISLAFFGTILVYLAGQTALGEGAPAMTWSLLLATAPNLDASLLNLAFVFLLIGYGTKVGLAPMHAWLPDAHSEGPTPITAIMSGLLLNVALYALLRFKMIVAAQPLALAPGPFMMALGLATLLFAALMLYQRRDIKRLFAYSSIEHMGLMTFAFGLGGPLVNVAAMLHVAMHGLTKSAIFFTVGHIAQVKRTQRIADITGLTVSQPWLGWSLVAGVFAIAGLPPFGVFMSEFLVVTSAFPLHPWLTMLAMLGLLLAFGALLLRLQDMLFGAPPPDARPIAISSAPMFLHLALVLAAGLLLPTLFADWLRHAAEVLR